MGLFVNFLTLFKQSDVQKKLAELDEEKAKAKKEQLRAAAEKRSAKATQKQFEQKVQELEKLKDESVQERLRGILNDEKAASSSIDGGSRVWEVFYLNLNKKKVPNCLGPNLVPYYCPVTSGPTGFITKTGT